MPISPPIGSDDGGGTGTATATEPHVRVTVDGDVIGLAGAGVILEELVPYSTQGDAVLTFSVVGGKDALTALPDPYLGKSILVEFDEGAGFYTLFSGRCVAIGHSYGPHGWSNGYLARGLGYLGNRVPVTHPSDGTDLIIFNGSPFDPNYDAAYAGRSVGAIVRETLESPEVAAGLTAYGIGDFTTGSGATAHATIGGGGSITITIDGGGTGYASGSPPSATLVGGDGTYDHEDVTVTVTGDAVTSITFGSSTGYTVVPEVWISILPQSTLDDLALIDHIPPVPVYVQGERVLDTLRAILQQHAPNHVQEIDPGTSRLRYKDIRAFSGPVTLTLDDADDLVDVTALQLSRSVEDCYQRVRVRGGPDVIAVTVGTAPLEGSSEPDNGLEERFEHDGLDNTQAKEEWSLERDWQQPQEGGRATFLATIATGAVTAVTIQSGGYGYAASSTYDLTFSGGGGSGATGTFTTDADGIATSTNVTAGGSGYTSAPTVTGEPPAIPNRDEGTCTCPSTTEVEVTSDDPNLTWPTNYWDQSASGRQGQIFLTYDVGTLVHQKYSARIVANDALTAGGTATITIEGVLPDTNFNYYEIVGKAGGGSDVWREYAVTNTAHQGKLLKFFPRPVPFRFADGQAATMTSTPVGWIDYSDDGEEPLDQTQIPIELTAERDGFRFDRPVVTVHGTEENLIEGGDATDGIPQNVGAMLAVNTGNLEAIQPPDSAGPTEEFEGTSNTVEGLAETLTITIPQWIDRVNQSDMDDFAGEVLDAVSDTVVEGTIVLYRYNGALLKTFGQKVQIDAAYSTPWDGIDLPIVEARLRFMPPGIGARHQTILRVSNRTAYLTAEHFVRPPAVGMELGGAIGGLEGLGVHFMGTPGASQFGGEWGAMGPGAQQWLGRATGMRDALLGTAQQGAANWLNLPGRGVEFAGRGGSRSDADPFTAARHTPGVMSPAQRLAMTPAAQFRSNSPSKTLTWAGGQGVGKGLGGHHPAKSFLAGAGFRPDEEWGG